MQGLALILVERNTKHIVIVFALRWCDAWRSRRHPGMRNRARRESRLFRAVSRCETKSRLCSAHALFVRIYIIYYVLCIVDYVCILCGAVWHAIYGTDCTILFMGTSSLVG